MPAAPINADWVCYLTPCVNFSAIEFPQTRKGDDRQWKVSLHKKMWQQIRSSNAQLRFRAQLGSSKTLKTGSQLILPQERIATQDPTMSRLSGLRYSLLWWYHANNNGCHTETITTAAPRAESSVMNSCARTVSSLQIMVVKNSLGNFVTSAAERNCGRLGYCDIREAFVYIGLKVHKIFWLAVKPSLNLPNDIQLLQVHMPLCAP